MSKQKIAILAGGPSCEREVSLVSGKAVLEAFRSKGWTAQLLDPMGDFIRVLRKENISFVFLALHGTFGEDGTVQRMLEEAGIGYTGSGIQASSIAFDKAKAQALFKKEGLGVPEFQVLRKKKGVLHQRLLPLPLVIKPAAAGSSVGISIVFKEQDFESACATAFDYSETILAEEYIRGRELTVGILGGQALPIVEVIPKRIFYDYEAKYRDSGTHYEVPASLEPSQANSTAAAALKAYEVLGCKVVARVDFIWSRAQKPILLEVNTLPGLTGKSLLPKAANAMGIDFPDLCVRILELSLESYKGKGERALHEVFQK